MSKLPVLTPQKIIRILEKKGFVLDREEGSHQIYYHPDLKKGSWSPFISGICPREHYLKS